jgi:deazaflavin-dependent oxidoreductase (nitroreductase family)
LDVAIYSRRVIEQFRAGGAIEGEQRARLLLLTTVGRRSGVRRTTPLMFHRVGDRLLVVAAFLGAPKYPEWYLNVKAHAGVELGDEMSDAVATALVDRDRERTWSMLKERAPWLSDFERKTARIIPVVSLTRSPAAQRVGGREG